MLQRRTFLGLLGGVTAGILGVTRTLASASWWRRADRVQDAARDSRTSSSAQRQSGIKITTAISRQGPRGISNIPAEPRTFYLQGEWRRLELPRAYSAGSSGIIYGPHIVNIARPDLGKTFELNLDAAEYTQKPYPPRQQPQPLNKEHQQARGVVPPSPGKSAKPTFRIETATKDTGERKEMFGYMARHVVTTRKEIPLEGSRRSAQETIADGWYIDLEPQLYPSLNPPQTNLSSRSGRGHAYVSASTRRPGEQPEAPERPEFLDVGEPETGFLVQELRTSKNTLTLPDGTTRQSEQKAETIVAIEMGTYSMTLFEVPSGFRRVHCISPNPA